MKPYYYYYLTHEGKMQLCPLVSTLNKIIFFIIFMTTNTTNIDILISIFLLSNYT